MKRAIVLVALVGLTFGVSGVGGVPASGSDRGRGWRQEQCQFKNVGSRLWSESDVERTIRCVASKQGVSATQALSVYGCETGHPYEAPHTDSYHGPMQYAVSTFKGQYENVKREMRRRYGHVVKRVHNIRANVTVAIMWASRHGWGPWSCA